MDSDEHPDPRIASRLAEIHASVPRILRYAFDKTVEKCMAGEPAYAQRLVAFERMSQILGYGLPDGLEKARQCLRFELTVDANVDVHVGWQSLQEHGVVDPPPLRVDEADFVGRGSKPLTFPTWTASGSYDGCSIHEAGVTPDVFTVKALTMQFNLFTEMQPGGRETDVVL